MIKFYLNYLKNRNSQNDFSYGLKLPSKITKFAYVKNIAKGHKFYYENLKFFKKFKFHYFKQKFKSLYKFEYDRRKIIYVDNSIKSIYPKYSEIEYLKNVSFVRNSYKIHKNKLHDLSRDLLKLNYENLYNFARNSLHEILEGSIDSFSVINDKEIIKNTEQIFSKDKNIKIWLDGLYHMVLEANKKQFGCISDYSLNYDIKAIESEFYKRFDKYAAELPKYEVDYILECLGITSEITFENTEILDIFIKEYIISESLNIFDIFKDNSLDSDVDIFLSIDERYKLLKSEKDIITSGNSKKQIITFDNTYHSTKKIDKRMLFDIYESLLYIAMRYSYKEDEYKLSLDMRKLAENNFINLNKIENKKDIYFDVNAGLQRNIFLDMFFHEFILDLNLKTRKIFLGDKVYFLNKLDKDIIEDFYRLFFDRKIKKSTINFADYLLNRIINKDFLIEVKNTRLEKSILRDYFISYELLLKDISKKIIYNNVGEMFLNKYDKRFFFLDNKEVLIRKNFKNILLDSNVDILTRDRKIDIYRHTFDNLFESIHLKYLDLFKPRLFKSNVIRDVEKSHINILTRIYYAEMLKNSADKALNRNNNLYIFNTDNYRFLKKIINKDILQELVLNGFNVKNLKDFEILESILRLERSFKNDIDIFDKIIALKREKYRDILVDHAGVLVDKKEFKSLLNEQYTKIDRCILRDFFAAHFEQFTDRNIFKEISDLESIVLRNKIKEFYIEKDFVTQNNAKELDIAEYKKFSKELEVMRENGEQWTKLFKRFWFINSLRDIDIKILPKDYDYESKPVAFNKEYINNDNFNSVYPNKFSQVVDRHPINVGENLGLNEIELSVDVMVEMINIFIMLWCKFLPAFWGWTGTQAITGITEAIFNWLVLESSIEENKMQEHYFRVFRWIRWEAEKFALLAKDDSKLNGNYYVSLMLEELIKYMEDHHFDNMPIFKCVEKMDEWKNIFNSCDSDVSWVVDKLKGIRDKIIIGKEKSENE